MQHTKNLELSEAIDQGLATLGWNAKPDGWRTASFDGLMAYVAPECPEINGEVLDSQDILITAILVSALEKIVKNDPFNQSSAGIIARAALAAAKAE